MEPTQFDEDTRYPVDKSAFPLETGFVGDYEAMLAASRVGVFATGFHYGWRNIVTLCMMWGLPIYADPFLIEHQWNRQGYTFWFNDTGNWENLEAVLNQAKDEGWLAQTKRANQELFDRNLAPQIVARSLIENCLRAYADTPTTAVPSRAMKE
jgi:hypothetical protein